MNVGMVVIMMLTDFAITMDANAKVLTNGVDTLTIIHSEQQTYLQTQIVQLNATFVKNAGLDFSTNVTLLNAIRVLTHQETALSKLQELTTAALTLTLILTAKTEKTR